MNIDAIAKYAKEHLLEEKEFAPMLFIEFKGLDELIISPIIGMPETTFEKQKLFFLIGRTIGLEHTPLKISQVCFVCEAWSSFIPIEEAETYPYNAPSKDPKRKECITIQSLDARTSRLKMTMTALEMLCDGSGELVDLLPMGKEITVEYNKPLIAFLAGTISAGMSESELERVLSKYR